MNSEQNQKISSLKELTGCSDSEAQFLLDASGWDLELASQTYFSEDHSPPTTARTVSSSSAPASQPVTHGSSAPSTSSNKSSSGSRSGGVKSLSDMRGDEKEDEDTMNWYAGGEKKWNSDTSSKEKG